MQARPWLIAYAVANAVLYSLLLPLWEGWDEPYHFAYVQQLANGQGLPDPDISCISAEVNDSIPLAPGSYIVKRNTPQLITFSDYFALPAARRQEMRRRLRAIPPELRRQSSNRANYEGLQAPLAYAVMAVPERLLAGVALPLRVTWLRVLTAIVAALLLLAGMERLLAELSVPAPFREAAVFCLLSMQTIWATLAHIANDGAAVVISVWTVVALVRYWNRPGLRTASTAALLLAAGLLTKAYFLALAPLPILLCVFRRRWRDMALTAIVFAILAAPWYARNLARYGDLSGTMESRGGIGPRQVAAHSPLLLRPSVLDKTLRSSLWSGNNSFLSFSAATLRVMAAVWAAALLLWILGRHHAGEWVAFLYCAVFWLFLGYATVADNITSGGANFEPRPWYAQPVAAPMLCLAFLGLSRARRVGRVLAAIFVLLSGYVLASTYAVKLIPLYGGFEGRTSLRTVADLYLHRLDGLTVNLNTVAMAPAPVIYAGAAAVIVLAGALAVVLIGGLWRTAAQSTP